MVANPTCEQRLQTEWDDKIDKAYLCYREKCLSTSTATILLVEKDECAYTDGIAYRQFYWLMLKIAESFKKQQYKRVYCHILIEDLRVDSLSKLLS